MPAGFPDQTRILAEGSVRGRFVRVRSKSRVVDREVGDFPTALPPGVTWQPLDCGMLYDVLTILAQGKSAAASESDHSRCSRNQRHPGERMVEFGRKKFNKDRWSCNAGIEERVS